MSITKLRARLSFFSVPCTPSDLNVDINCQTNVAVLSWNNSKGAVKYLGLAQSANGDTFNCNTTNSSCTLKPMQCGNVYNFTVKACDGICNSSFSSPLQAGAGNYWLEENGEKETSKITGGMFFLLSSMPSSVTERPFTENKTNALADDNLGQSQLFQCWVHDQNNSPDWKQPTNFDGRVFVLVAEAVLWATDALQHALQHYFVCPKLWWSQQTVQRLFWNHR